MAKERAEAVGDVDATAGKIALAALHYFLLQVSPYKDMVFNPKESLSFNGNTGPYLQYMSARINSMLDKYRERSDEFAGASLDSSLLNSEAEWELVKLISSYPSQVKQSAAELNPSIVAAHLYDTAKAFSRFYHDCPILGSGDKNLTKSRVALSEAVLQV